VSARFPPPRASPPFVALRPRVGARSPMSGASWWAAKAAGLGRNAHPIPRGYVEGQRARPGCVGRRGRSVVQRWRAARRLGDWSSRTRFQSVERPPTGKPSRRAIRFASLAHERKALVSHRTRSPPSIALRPRVAARPPMSGASLPATEAAACARETLSQSRRSPRAVRCGMWAVRFARLELELDYALFAPACASPPSIAMRPRVAARWSPILGGKRSH
jgi:hypothetical protein